MRERYQGEFPEQFLYRTKALFVFEEIDGVDVCFFGMHVQEYGSNCHAPNTRLVFGSDWLVLSSSLSSSIIVFVGVWKDSGKYS